MGPSKLILLLISFLVGCKGQNSCSFKRTLNPNDEPLSIESPNFPYDSYIPGSGCEWTATTGQGAVIELSCPVVEIYKEGSCTDGLVVSDNANGNNGQVYCGRTSIHHVTSGSVLNVKFYSSPSSRGGRFYCIVRAVATGSNPQPPLVTSPPDEPCNCGYSYNTRIVGGTETGINEFPMMVGLVSYSLRDVFCGGTIISKRWAVSAAHCLETREASDLALLVGDHDITTGAETNSSRLVKVSRIVSHPQYDPVKLQNDIGLLETQVDIVFSARVGPACLPFNHPESLDHQQVQAVGWGSVFFGGARSNYLQKVTLEVVSITRCQSVYGEKILPSAQMCIYGEKKDACQFDSGGPVLWINPNNKRYTLVAVLSYGRGCATGNPSVNTRVFHYLPWIQEYLPTGSYCIAQG